MYSRAKVTEDCLYVVYVASWELKMVLIEQRSNVKLYVLLKKSPSRHQHCLIKHIGRTVNKEMYVDILHRLRESEEQAQNKQLGSAA